MLLDAFKALEGVPELVQVNDTLGYFKREDEFQGKVEGDAEGVGEEGLLLTIRTPLHYADEDDDSDDEFEYEFSDSDSEEADWDEDDNDSIDGEPRR